MFLFDSNHTYIDVKYINLLSSSLERFKRKKSNLFNFRCPFCGDSHKNRYKARGYIYENRGKYFFRCHNCEYGTTFNSFLKQINYELYKEYQFEILQEKNELNNLADIADEVNATTNELKIEKSVFSELKTIDELPLSSLPKQYIINRKIPQKFFKNLYYVENFRTFTNNILPGKFSEESLKYDEGRIIIPLMYKDNSIIGYQGRSLDSNSKQKYITIILNDELPKIYGLNNIDYTKDIFVTEGPFDSMFLDNAIAMCGSDGISFLSSLDKEKIIFVYDNEPRNKQIKTLIKKVIDAGYRVVIYPEYVTEKDINEMILSGEISDINKMLRDNVYRGLTAQLEFGKWSR